MPHFLTESFAIGWIIAIIAAVRWHHALMMGSQGDFNERFPEEIENLRRTFILDVMPAISSENGLHAIERA